MMRVVSDRVLVGVSLAEMISKPRHDILRMMSAFLMA